MAPSPIPILIIVLATLAFEGLLFGDEIAEQSFPNFTALDGSCTGDGFFSGIACAIEKFVDFFAIIFGAIAFFFNLISFNIPGAPWFIRLILGGIFGASLLWSLTSLLRGN